MTERWRSRDAPRSCAKRTSYPAAPAEPAEPEFAGFDESEAAEASWEVSTNVVLSAASPARGAG